MSGIDYLEELRTRKRVLRVNSSFYWFDMVATGQKGEEYRGLHWMPRVLVPEACSESALAVLSNLPRIPECHVKPVIIEIVRGYTSDVQHFVIDQVRIGLPRREWSEGTIHDKCFGFKLGEQLTRR